MRWLSTGSVPMYKDEYQGHRRLDADTTLPRMLSPERNARAATTSPSPASYHMQQCAKGFASGLVVVVPAAIWFSGVLDSRVAPSANARMPPVVISQVAVRPIPTPDPETVATPTSTTPQQAEAQALVDRQQASEAAVLSDRLDEARALIGVGKIAEARDSLSDPELKELPEALYLLAGTFDPNILAALGVVRVRAEPDKARSLYERALTGGIAAARQRLQSLQ